ncbi:MAG: T9SS type A sorting domain-containing protein [Candidatus Latescibacteria bacterium]|nr:T9SS type A sorting domain-containing protein [Candidatus Latescibacterota bacterium]NIM64516.1 T9SS type A sorting domain-containing protein [Candidatus Latescibacterota bacterium]NIO00669.1 T9SS type A sorting domain-containing protein [Candidatus Latescibacterota bacterium]NIO27072.1 T9SS type A sorting domain-containing protein [Candidatus Latescibacterota bacterium]NIO54596.1 T9SS type A sorting domain-containing protein [Candidatus Latescibacterota bacterium]
MTPFIRSFQSLFLLCIAASLLYFSPDQVRGYTSDDDLQLTDSLYNAHHPRLLFTDTEIPALYNKVRDGGNDDNAYTFIRLVVQYIYPGSSEIELLDGDYGLATIPNLGIAAFLESPKDTASIAMGRNLTLYIADNYNVDNNDFESSLRLRALTLGYDMFFESSTEAVRDYLRDEIISYIDTMTTSRNYEVYCHRPYLGNRSVMIASSLGLAAVCLDEETDPSRLTAANEFAERIISTWLLNQVDEDGAYKEGLLYGAWSMRNLVYYFYARKRYDGFDHAATIRIRNMENWFAYELLPEGSGRTNNLNDCGWNDFVLSRHHTYFDWAQYEWGSNLSAWIWDYTAGANGWDAGLKADKAAIVIWNQNLPHEQPENVLPKNFLWKSRGLYYYRSGWTLSPSSKDVVFSFYSGKFQGGHAQEDQGQFTLYGYGAKFAIDHGPGTVAKQSEAHNIILIDSLGQHNAGKAIGTDGILQQFLLSNYADFLVGDLTDAYTTHSTLNNPGVPFPGTDWSWGYDGGNPVNFARRTVIAVHDSLLRPYFILFDDIDKDGLPHRYDWRLHTHDANTIDTSGDPIRISKGSSYLDLHLIEPPLDSVQTTVAPFNNLSSEPDALVLSLSVMDTSLSFALLLFPSDGTITQPAVNKETHAWGYTLLLNWGGGVTDLLVKNIKGGPITYTMDTSNRAKRLSSRKQNIASASANISMTTDASLALVRIDSSGMAKYLLTNVSEFTYNDTDYVSVSNGPLCCGLSGGVIQIDRYDADFIFYAPGVNQVFYREQKIHVISQDGYLTPDPLAGITERPLPENLLCVKVYPNPFNPSTTVLVELPRGNNVEAAIYDPAGRLIRHLWRDALPRGTSLLHWDGTNEKGNRVASGVYFLRIRSPGVTKTLKLALLK